MNSNAARRIVSAARFVSLSRAGGHAGGAFPPDLRGSPRAGARPGDFPGTLVLLVAARRKQRYAFPVKEIIFIFIRKIMANLPGNRPSPQAGHAFAPGRERRRP